MDLSDIVKAETERRRTFAIISHPDAGKTTFTEKLLLYGGAIRLAGSVRARRNQNKTTSDWMNIEQERGISITSAALQFEYNGYCLNLLDTPGHHDFSEDTYRTLTAADSAVMVLDAAKGVEEQTKKLFRVCRRRNIPIATFINKMDRLGRDPLALLDEVEEILGITAVPLNWPIGSGDEFTGVYDRTEKRIYLYERTTHNQQKAPVIAGNADDPAVRELIGPDKHDIFLEEMEILREVVKPFTRDAFLSGEMTPVFFGSALTNFGVERFLAHFIALSPLPGEVGDNKIRVDEERFTGFIFKVQANMNQRHRDRIAFVRICSGRFERGMTVKHLRTGKMIRLSSPHVFFAQERAVIDEAWPGDIIGLINPGTFRIGDALCERGELSLPPFPRFAPECFATVRPYDPAMYKGFHKGLQQLFEEGVVQVYYPLRGAHDPMLGAVGQLQFEVFVSRLEAEYSTRISIEHHPYTIARWIDKQHIDEISGSGYAGVVLDDQDRAVALFKKGYDLRFTEKKYPHIVFSELPPSDTCTQDAALA
ncbi:MAG: peptide chain release factor 3 [bacterium]|jgi:peptide chain release factor 3|nr:peptide chain release factor 3 [bacterium]